ncbi:TPA: hypothetical protein WMT92_000864, partial [Neisseria gonorrhoeae]
GRALPLLIPRYRCRLNLQTAFLIARRLQARGGRGNTRTVIPDNTVILKPVRQHRNLETRPTTPQSRNPSDNTAISKPVIPAQAGIRTPDAAGIYRK